MSTLVQSSHMVSQCCVLWVCIVSSLCFAYAEERPFSVSVRHSNTNYSLYLVTYATEVSRADFCIFATSASAHGFRLNVLGQESRFRKYGWPERVWTLRKFMKIISDEPNTIVVFMDSYDTIINSSPHDLVAAFIDTGASVLFSSERGCGGTKWDLKHRNNACDSQWPLPPVKTTMPFLNSGGFVAFRSELVVLLDVCRKEYRALQRSLLPGEFNAYVIAGDQQLYSQLFSYGMAERNSDDNSRGALRKALGMSLDYHSQIFLSMYKVDLDTEIHYTANGTLVTTGLTDCSHLDRRMYYEACLGVQPKPTTPVVVHLNGRPKPLKEVAQRLGGKYDKTLWDARIWLVRGEQPTVADVCKKYVGTCSPDMTPWACLSESL